MATTDEVFKHYQEGVTHERKRCLKAAKHLPDGWEVRICIEKLVSRCTARLQESGVFKGAHGLEGLAESNEFWEQQPYGTRLYYGDGITEYLHRDVIRAAIKILNG